MEIVQGLEDIPLWFDFLASVVDRLPEDPISGVSDKVV